MSLDRPPDSNSAAKLAIPPEALAAMRKGDWIAAIKVLRQVKGIGLAEAKAALEQLQREMPRAPAGMALREVQRARNLPPGEAHRAKGLSPGEVPRGAAGDGATWIVVVAGAALMIFWAVYRY